MESDPPNDSLLPPGSASAPPPPASPTPPAPAPAPESAHDRHTREFEHSLEVLEDTVEHGIERTLKLAVPALIAVVLAAYGTYVLGGWLRDRAVRRRIARATRRSR